MKNIVDKINELYAVGLESVARDSTSRVIGIPIENFDSWKPYYEAACQFVPSWVIPLIDLGKSIWAKDVVRLCISLPICAEFYLVMRHDFTFVSFMCLTYIAPSLYIYRDVTTFADAIFYARNTFDVKGNEEKRARTTRLSYDEIQEIRISIRDLQEEQRQIRPLIDGIEEELSNWRGD